MKAQVGVGYNILRARWFLQDWVVGGRSDNFGVGNVYVLIRSHISNLKVIYIYVNYIHKGGNL